MSGKERKFGSMEIAGEITTPSAIRRKRRMRLLKLCGVGVIVATIVILLIVLIVRGNDNSSNSSGKYTIDVYINGVIYAKPPYLESVDSFAVDKQLGRFIAVGAENDVIADVESRFCTDCYNTIDLNEITVLPGLIDAHGHILSLGATLKNIDLYTANSLQMMRDMVEDFITNRSLASEGEWIVGRGWDQVKKLFLSSTFFLSYLIFAILLSLLLLTFNVLRSLLLILIISSYLFRRVGEDQKHHSLQLTIWMHHL